METIDAADWHFDEEYFYVDAAGSKRSTGD
jgi:hypothetical protein